MQVLWTHVVLDENGVRHSSYHDDISSEQENEGTVIPLQFLGVSDMDLELKHF